MKAKLLLLLILPVSALGWSSPIWMRSRPGAANGASSIAGFHRLNFESIRGYASLTGPDLTAAKPNFPRNVAIAASFPLVT
jgi:hypothetical protein